MDELVLFATILGMRPTICFVNRFFYTVTCLMQTFQSYSSEPRSTHIQEGDLRFAMEVKSQISIDGVNEEELNNPVGELKDVFQ